MSSISKRINKNGTETFVVQIRLTGAKPVNRSFSNLEDAQRFSTLETARVYEQIRGSRLATDSRSFYTEMSADTFQLYIERATPNRQQEMHLRSAMRFIGNLKNGELSMRSMRDFVARMRRAKTYRKTPYKDASIARLFTVMSTAYQWRAEQFDLSIQTPFSRKILGKDWDIRRTRRLSPAEELALRNVFSTKRAEVESYWSALMTMALETGARLQELVFATWAEFSLSTDRKHWIIPAKHCKTRRERIVPLSPAAIQALATIQKKGARATDRVFGLYAGPGCVSATFRRFAQQAGLVDFRFHDFRHEAITRLKKRNLDPTVLRCMVGHTKDSMTDRYIHLLPEEVVDIYRHASPFSALPLASPARASSAEPSAITNQAAPDITPTQCLPLEGRRRFQVIAGGKA